MNTSGDSTVSVCMPVYNGSDYIEESIRSVLSQTYTNFQLIVSDNCSTDNTEQIVRSFGDPRIVYSLNEKNLGLVGNANRCLALATGDYVNILHHDDIMRPDNLQRKVCVLDEHPEVGFVHSDVGFIDQNGETLNLTKFDANRDYIERGIELFQKYILRMPIGAAFFIGAVMARRDCYLKLGGFNHALTATNDSEMWMRMLLFYDVACIGERLVYYRLHDMMTSTTTNDTEGFNIVGLQEHYQACRIVLETYPDRIPQCRRLSRKVSTAFSIKAVKRAMGFLCKRDFGQSMAYLKMAHQFDRIITLRKGVWTFIASLILKTLKQGAGVRSNPRRLENYQK